MSQFMKRYSTHKQVGFGAFGIVFRVQRALDKEFRAVKMIPLKSSRGLIDNTTLGEVQKMSRLCHPGVVKYYYSWQEEPCEGYHVPTVDSAESYELLQNIVSQSDSLLVFIEMEFCDESVEQWLKRNKKTRNQKQMKSWFKQIVDAVQYIHSQGVIHRDLKPSNILVYAEEKVKICDLGISTDFQLGHGITWRTDIGTPMYKAPEQIFTYIRCGKVRKIQQDNASTLDLITKLTKLDWDERPSPDEILEHSFFNIDDSDDSDYDEDYRSRFSYEFGVNKILGTGWDGIVIDATSNIDGKHYAVKRIAVDAKAYVDTLREIRVLAQFTHPGFVHIHSTWMESPPVGWKQSYEYELLEAIYSSGKYANRKYLEKYYSECEIVFIFAQMDICKYSLAEWLENNMVESTRSISRMKSWFKQMTSSVAFMHDNGLVHGDLKPSSFLFFGDDTLKLSDLGAINEREDEVLDRIDGHPRKFRVGWTSRHPYKSPEQRGMFPEHNLKMDVYSLGLILTELCVVIPSVERRKIFNELWFRQPWFIKDAEIREFVGMLTDSDPNNRPSCKDMLNHHFFA